MADLFNRNKANKFVWCVFANADRSNPKKTVYVLDDQSDWMMSQYKHSHTPVVERPIGIYDKEGYYCTHIPGVDGVTNGRYIRHPNADPVEAERQTINRRYGAKPE